MSETRAKGEAHGCIVCGRLYQLLVVHDAQGNYIGSKVMSAGGKAVQDPKRPLVACEKHTEDEIKRAVRRVFGDQIPEDD
jgi:hypothetical protein